LLAKKRSHCEEFGKTGRRNNLTNAGLNKSSHLRLRARKLSHEVIFYAA
jgi:hypothetical protein